MNFDKSHLNGGGQLAVVTHDKPDPVETRVARLVAFGAYVEDGTASALKARDYKDHTDLIYVYHNGRYGAPRRLMPIECERLMDWQAVNERGWTEIDDGNGKVAADSHRYRACGNGVVSACVEWIGLRLRDALMHHRVGLSR
jgi:DNA (cytosine-5)-methyltransferase 1